MVANVRTKYQTDSGDIHPIVLKPETAAAAGGAPAGAITQNVKVQVSKSKRAYGIKPRGVTLARTLGTAPLTYTVSRFLPLLSQVDYNDASANIGESITVGGVAWIIVAKSPEDYN